MLHESMDVHQAVQYVSALHDHLAENFLSTFKQIPSFDSAQIDQWVCRYVDGLGGWIRANERWSFESWRYFQNEGERIQRDRVVELLPPADHSDLYVPAESRWIKSAVIPDRPQPQDAGIIAMEMYFPKRVCIQSADGFWSG